MKYPDKAQFEKANVFGKGNPNTAYAQYFKVIHFKPVIKTR